MLRKTKGRQPTATRNHTTTTATTAESSATKGYSLTGLIDLLWEVPCDPDFAVTRVAFSRHQLWEQRHLTKSMLRRIPIISFGSKLQLARPRPETESAEEDHEEGEE